MGAIFTLLPADIDLTDVRHRLSLVGLIVTQSDQLNTLMLLILGALL